MNKYRFTMIGISLSIGFWGAEACRTTHHAPALIVGFALALVTAIAAALEL